MAVIEMARELGKAIQEDERYLRLDRASKANDNDKELQSMISAFNGLRMQLNQEAAKSEKDQALITDIDKNLKELYTEIMKRDTMIEFNEAKQDIDKIMGFVNQILVGSISGKDPYSIEESAGCSSDCSSCAGCGS